MQYGSGINWAELHEKHAQAAREALQRQLEREIQNLTYYPPVVEAVSPEDAVPASATASGGGGGRTQTSSLFQQTYLFLFYTGSDMNWQSVLMDVETSKLYDIQDTGISTDYYVQYSDRIQNKGYAFILRNNSAPSEEQVKYLLLGSDGNIVDVITCSSSEVQNLKWNSPRAYTFQINKDNHYNLYFFNGDELFVKSISYDYCAGASFEWHWDLHSLNMFTSYVIYFGDGTSSIHIWNGVNDYELYRTAENESAYITLAVFCNFISIAVIDNKVNAYSKIKLFDESGNSLADDIDMTNYSYNDNYDYELEPYGINKALGIFRDSNDINVPYRIIHYNGDTKVLIDTTTERGINYQNWDYVEDYLEVDSNMPYLQTSNAIVFYSNDTQYPASNFDIKSSYIKVLTIFSDIDDQFYENYIVQGGINTVTNLTGSGVPGSITYEGVLGSTGSISGASNARFSVQIDEVGNYYLTVEFAGNNYLANDSITIPGSSLGGVSPDNDLTFTVDQLVYIPTSIGYNMSDRGHGGYTSESIIFTIYTGNNSLTSLILLPGGHAPSLGGVSSEAYENIGYFDYQRVGKYMAYKVYLTNGNVRYSFVDDQGNVVGETDEMYTDNADYWRFGFNSMVIRDWNNENSYVANEGFNTIVPTDGFFSVKLQTSLNSIDNPTTGIRNDIMVLVNDYTDPAYFTILKADSTELNYFELPHQNGWRAVLCFHYFVYAYLADDGLLKIRFYDLEGNLLTELETQFNDFYIQSNGNGNPLISGDRLVFYGYGETEGYFLATPEGISDVFVSNGTDYIGLPNDTNGYEND